MLNPDPPANRVIFLLAQKAGARINVVFVQKAHDIFVKKVLYYKVEENVP